MATTRTQVLRRRFAVQRLSAPGLPSAADVVRLLTCVQSQEHAHALWSIGIRTSGSTYAGVQADFDRGAFLRTHILRPTWHYVAPEDLRWILALTTPRVMSLRRGHCARIGLDEGVARKGEKVLGTVLAGRNALTRKEIAAHMQAAGLPSAGLPLGDLLMMNELLGVIVSGPMKGAQHTHVLVDEVVPPSPELDRDEALGRLAHRFFAGHGPASLKDLCRWATLTQADVRRGIEVAGDALKSLDSDGTPLWFDPSVPARRSTVQAAYLFPVYDEAILTYPVLNVGVAEGHPRGDGADPDVDPYAGSVVVDLVNVGTWRRRLDRSGVNIELRLAPGTTGERVALVEAEADRLAAFLGRPRLHPPVEVIPGRA